MNCSAGAQRALSCVPSSVLAAALLAPLAIGAIPPPLHGQTPVPATELFQLGAVGVVEREIGHMGTHIYEVKLAAGEFLRFSFKVRGLFGTVTVEDPSGARITQRRSESNVVVLGEAAMLTAQVMRRLDGTESKFGMNVPGNHNRQFVLNVLHWLSRVLP